MTSPPWNENVSDRDNSSIAAATPLSGAICAEYQAEMEQFLVQRFDGLLRDSCEDGDLEAVANAIVTLLSDGRSPDPSNVDEAAVEWLNALRQDPVPLRRAKAQARLALGPGFWCSIDGAAMTVEFEVVDPFDHYEMRQVAWDQVSHVLLGQFASRARELRVNWLGQAASKILGIGGYPARFDYVGVDAARYAENDHASAPIARRVFQAAPRSWRLHRVGSTIDLRGPKGDTARCFRDVTIHPSGPTPAAMTYPYSETVADGARLISWKGTRSTRKGISYAVSDQPWIDAMQKLRQTGEARSAQDAARAVVNMQFAGVRLAGRGTAESKSDRLRRRFVDIHGPW